MIRRLTIYIAFVLSLFAAACSQDLGNYDYIELDDPGIGGITDVSALMFSKIHIEPSFAEPFDKNLYDFEWKVLESSGYSEAVVIGNGPVLDYEITLSPGSYILYFIVKEKSSGIYWKHESTLVVNSATSEGWMVLCSDQGRARLDFVSEVTQETIADVLAAGGMPVMNGPRKIQWLSSMTDAASPYYLLTDDGATRLGKDAFEWKPEYDFAYESAVAEKLTPYSIAPAGFGKVIVSNGKAHYCEIMGFDGLYGSAVNKNFNVSQYVGVNVLATQVYAAVYLLYNQDAKKMMAYCPLLTTNDLGALNPLMDMDEFAQVAEGMNPGNGLLGNAFAGWPVGFDCLYMENTRYDPGNGKMGMTYALLSDGTGTYVYGVQLGDLLCYADCTYVLGKGGYCDVSSCNDITKPGTLYAFSSLKNYMYYAAGGKVYRVDLSQSPAKEQFQFALTGEEITCMKFNLYQTDDYMRRSYDLIIASQKDGEGIFRVYDGMTADGDFSNVTPQIYTGFEKIVDITYKEKIY